MCSREGKLALRRGGLMYFPWFNSVPGARLGQTGVRYSQSAGITSLVTSLLPLLIHGQGLRLGSKLDSQLARFCRKKNIWRKLYIGDACRMAWGWRGSWGVFMAQLVWS